MALNLITNPATPPTTNPGDWNNFVTREDASNIGAGIAIDTISLTNWDAATIVPAIAIGTKIEVGGSMYLADSDTALVDDTGLVDGAVHIKLVPSGGTVIPTLTSDSIPIWSSAKGGWYDSDDKFLPFEMTRSGTSYSNKKRFPYQNKAYSFSSVGDASFTGSIFATGSVLVNGNIGAASVTSGTSPLKWKTFTGTFPGGTTVVVNHGVGSSFLCCTLFRTTSAVSDAEYILDTGTKITNTQVLAGSTYASGVKYNLVLFYS